MRRAWKIWRLKRRLKSLYLQAMRVRGEMDCGDALARYVSGRLNNMLIEIDEVKTELFNMGEKITVDTSTDAAAQRHIRMMLESSNRKMKQGKL